LTLTHHEGRCDDLRLGTSTTLGDKLTPASSMSARYHTETHRHPFTWETVASAIFQRYPNPLAEHVLSEDTLFRGVVTDEVSGRPTLYSRRFLTKTNKFPKWGEPFMPASLRRYVPLVEESRVDPATQTIVTYTRNVGLSRFMSAVERVCYKPDPENPTQTLAVKEAWIESGLYGIRSAVKNFGIERFKTNCHRATDGFNLVMAHLHTRQQYLKDMQMKKFQQIRQTGETVIASAKAKAASATPTVLAESPAAAAMSPPNSREVEG